MDVSVVISTYNRAHMLPQTLASVCESGRGATFEWEIVVVDNNSTDDTPTVVTKLARAEPRIRYAFEPRQGVSFGRNTGVELSRGSLILFTDDDIVVEQRWLPVAYKAFGDESLAFIMGRILPFWVGDPPDWVPPGLTGPLGICDLGDSPIPLGAASPHLPMTANMGVRRDVFIKLGGLNTDLGPQGRYGANGAGNGYFSGEDYEFGLRLIEAGYRGLYVPTLVVRNGITPERATKDYFRRWMSANGRAYAIMGRGREHNLRKWLGVPRFMFRRAARHALLWTWCLGSGNSPAAFGYELRLRAFVGFLTEHWTGRH